jgi:hypothetical protein
MTNFVRADASKVLKRLDKVQRVANEIATKNAASAASKAAAVATQATQASWTSQLSGRPTDRRSDPGRPSTQGGGVSLLTWRAQDGAVRFNWQAANNIMPYLIIQEVGTGRAASIQDPAAGTSGTFNVPTKSGAVQRYTIPSQRGRFISPRLLWSDRMGGSPMRRASGPNQNAQLYPASMLDPTEVANFRSSRKRIRREIRGKHAIREGGIQGFRKYDGLIAIEWQRISQALRP